MWRRIQRVFKSFVGFFVASAEDPELILEQNIRDLNDQVPKLNESIAMIRANVSLLEKEHAKLQRTAAELKSKIKAAIQADRDDLAAQYAMELERVGKAIERNQIQLEPARAAYEKALNVKKAFMREKERRTREALDAIRAHKRAQWQLKVSEIFEGMELTGVDPAHDDMLRKIEEKTALADARMEIAIDGGSQEQFLIEEDAERIRAQELVRQMKAELAEAETPKQLEEKASAAPATASTEAVDEEVPVPVEKVEAK